MVSQTNLMQAENILKKTIQLGLNMDLAVAKLNLAAMSTTKLEATNLITEVKRLDKQGMLKDQIKLMKIK
jgi:hypothetical protein